MPTQRITVIISQNMTGIEATIAKGLLGHPDGRDEEIFDDQDIGVPYSGVSWVKHVAEEVRRLCPRIAAADQLIHISADWSDPPTYVYDWVHD